MAADRVVYSSENGSVSSHLGLRVGLIRCFSELYLSVIDMANSACYNASINTKSLLIAHCKRHLTDIHVRLGSLKNSICTSDVENTSRTAVVLERSLERVDTAGLQAISGRP